MCSFRGLLLVPSVTIRGAAPDTIVRNVIFFMTAAKSVAQAGRFPRSITSFATSRGQPMAKVKPPADLSACAGDEVLPIEELKQLAIFDGVNIDRLELASFPGAMVLRRVRK